MFSNFTDRAVVRVCMCNSRIIAYYMPGTYISYLLYMPVALYIRTYYITVNIYTVPGSIIYKAG